MYYSNSVASFHLPLTGDLVFKLNPGPVQNGIPNIVTSIRSHGSSYHCNQRSNVNNLLNLTNLNLPLSSSSSTVNHLQDPLLFGLLNARSVKNKTAVLVDYLYDRKIHLLTMTETCMKSDLKETGLYMDCAHKSVPVLMKWRKLANEYNSALSKLIDKHAPRKTKTVRTRTSTPWYSAEICAAIKLKRKLERKWRKSGLPEDFKSFKAQHNHVTNMMNDARRIFYIDFIAENSADQGKLFRAAKKFLAKKEAPHFPEYCDNTVIANEIGRFFARKIELIRSGIDANGPMSSKDQVMNNRTSSNEDMALSSFQLLTENDMRDIIQRSARKSREFDPMPT